MVFHLAIFGTEFRTYELNLGWSFDSRNRALPEAGRAKHIDFAAPGADMAAALPGQGYAKVRGTSFAAPLVIVRTRPT